MVSSNIGGENNDDSGHKEESFPSLDIVLDFTRERQSAQLQLTTDLDSKANFVLGSATLLTTAAIALRNATSSWRWLEVVAILVYCVVVFSSFMAYRVREYAQAPDPVALESNMHEAVVKTKGEILREMVRAYDTNKTAIRRKTAWLKWSFVAFMIEVVLLAALAFAQVWN